MENECEFVSSRGLLKSCDFYSSKAKSSCNNDYNYLLNMLKSNKMKDGMTIYVCSDLLKYFVYYILPKIKNKFVLLSGDSDLCVPIEILNQRETMLLVHSPFLIKWFAQNTRIQETDKINQMPIGLDYHTIFHNLNCKWRQNTEDILPLSQENILKNVLLNALPFYERIPKIYVNFTINNDRFKQRQKSLKTIPKDLMHINQQFTPRTLNWEQMIKYTFVLSPFGVGMDCHRTWEALCLGCIPIVCAPHFKNLFNGLPVLNVNDWNDINETLLLNTINQFKETNFNYQKLTLDYWKRKIASENIEI